MALMFDEEERRILADLIDEEIDHRRENAAYYEDQEEFMRKLAAMREKLTQQVDT